MKYLDPIDPTDFKRPAVMIARLIPEGGLVLDVGCAGGRVARLLKEKGCRVVGVENDSELASLAKAVCDEVIVGDVEDPAVMAQVPGGFQAIVCADVLEHLRDPARVLVSLKGKLAPGGRTYVAIPNLLMWRARWQLLRGRFHYEETGIFDESHLRFYSYDSAKALCRASGHRIRQEHFAWDVPFANRMAARLRHRSDRTARAVVRVAEWLAIRRPGLVAGHFVFVLEPE